MEYVAFVRILDKIDRVLTALYCKGIVYRIDDGIRQLVGMLEKAI